MEILNTIKSFIATGGINLLFSAICAIVFVLIGFKLSGKISKLIHRSKYFQHMDDSARSFIGSFISIGLKVLIVIIAASILGINGTALASVIGTAGVAIGLAMQGSLSNLVGCMISCSSAPSRSATTSTTTPTAVRSRRSAYSTLCSARRTTRPLPFPTAHSPTQRSSTTA